MAIWFQGKKWYGSSPVAGVFKVLGLSLCHSWRAAMGGVPRAKRGLTMPDL